MTTQVLIQSRVARGFAVAARQAGEAVAWYRPSGTAAPIAAGNLLGWVRLYADTKPDGKASAPLHFAASILFGAFDTTAGVLPGDYFVDPVWGTLFVASIPPFRMALLIRCSITVTLLRARAGTGYGGDTMDTLASSWPAAGATGKGKVTGSVLGLPDNPRTSGALIQLPVSFATQVRPGDLFIDSQAIPFAYLVEGADPSAEGWLITASTRTP